MLSLSGSGLRFNHAIQGITSLQVRSAVKQPQNGPKGEVEKDREARGLGNLSLNNGKLLAVHGFWVSAGK